ncbi:unnamed protein product [Ectocarpus sp. 12 AP-2014]
MSPLQAQKMYKQALFVAPLLVKATCNTGIEAETEYERPRIYFAYKHAPHLVIDHKPTAPSREMEPRLPLRPSGTNHSQSSSSRFGGTQRHKMLIIPILRASPLNWIGRSFITSTIVRLPRRSRATRFWNRYLPYTTQDNTPPEPIFKTRFLNSRKSHSAEDGGVQAVSSSSSRAFRKRSVSFMHPLRRGVIELQIGLRGVLSCVVYGTRGIPPNREGTAKPGSRLYMNTLAAHRATNDLHSKTQHKRVGIGGGCSRSTLPPAPPLPSKGQLLCP